MKTLAEIMQRIGEIEALVKRGEVTEALEKELDKLLEDKKAAEARQAELQSKFNQARNVQQVQRTQTDVQATYRSAWLKRMMGQRLTENENEVYERAITSSSSSGGAAIPMVTANRILEALGQEGIIISEVTISAIPGLKLPVEDEVSDAAWVAEGAGGSDGTDKLVDIVWLAHDLIKIVTITAQMELMSIDSFEDWLVSMISRKMAHALDKATFYGAGSSSNQPTGIDAITWVDDPTPGANRITTADATKITYAEMTSLLALMKAAYKRGAKFYMSTSMLYNKVAGILDDNKRPIFVNNPENGNEGKVMGYPVVVYDEISSSEIFFGNLKRYQINFSKSIDILSDRSVEFKSAKTVYRGHALVDGKILSQKAFVKLRLKP